jgi:mRNA-degrading endonuclease toxin of MazEF toxin-antitoxin module
VPTNRSKAQTSAFAPFDVVVVPFPYTDRLAEKRRPAVVISAPELSKNYGLVWLLMVTSADNPRWDCDIAVSDLKEAGLPAASLVRIAKIATADADRILRRIGKLSAKDAHAVAAELKALMAR